MRRFIHARSRITRPRAFTLAEALIATTVLSVVAMTALLPFAAGLQNTQEAVKFEQAVELGEAMMEEVLARPFFAPTSTAPSPGPEVGEPRKLFDTIDDFDGFTEFNTVSQQGELADFSGLEIDDAPFAGFHREVSVTYVNFADQAAGDDNAFAHVQVRVYHDQSLQVTLDRLVAREN